MTASAVYVFALSEVYCSQWLYLCCVTFPYCCFVYSFVTYMVSLLLFADWLIISLFLYLDPPYCSSRTMDIPTLIGHACHCFKELCFGHGFGVSTLSICALFAAVRICFNRGNLNLSMHFFIFTHYGSR